MVKEKTYDTEFGKRLLSLREGEHLSQKLAAEKIGIGLSSLQNYEKGDTPTPRNIKKIQVFYGCNKIWLLTGEGVPFPNRQESPLYKPKEPYEHQVNEHYMPFEPAGRAPDIDIGEDVKQVIRVLSSKTHYATSLHMNIRSFAQSVEMGNELKQCREEIKELKVQINELREEMKKLKGSVGGCPPIDLSSDIAAPTGTDDQKTT